MAEKKRITKTLANCKPSEFLKQTNRIRKSAMKWLEVTNIMNIRKHMPEVTDDMTEDERKKAIAKQVNANLNDMLDAILEKNPDETLELLALMCFVEPEDVDDYPVMDYLNAATALIGDSSVISFFTSLVRLANSGIFG